LHVIIHGAHWAVQMEIDREKKANNPWAACHRFRPAIAFQPGVWEMANSNCYCC